MAYDMCMHAHRWPSIMLLNNVKILIKRCHEILTSELSGKFTKSRNFFNWSQPVEKKCLQLQCNMCRAMLSSCHSFSSLIPLFMAGEMRSWQCRHINREAVNTYLCARDGWLMRTASHLTRGLWQIQLVACKESPQLSIPSIRPKHNYVCRVIVDLTCILQTLAASSQAFHWFIIYWLWFCGYLLLLSSCVDNCQSVRGCTHTAGAWLLSWEWSAIWHVLSCMVSFIIVRYLIFRVSNCSSHILVQCTLSGDLSVVFGRMQAVGNYYAAHYNESCHVSRVEQCIANIEKTLFLVLCRASSFSFQLEAL
jgi:hypothetical protein